MIDAIDSVPTVAIAGQVVRDPECAFRLAIHQQLDDLRSERADAGPGRERISFLQAPQTEHVQLVAGPVHHADGLDDRDGNRVIRPDAAIEQTDIVISEMSWEVGRRGGSRERRVHGKDLVVAAQPLMVRRLVDVDISRGRIPRRDQQPARRIPEALVFEDFRQGSAQMRWIVFRPEQRPR